ncbi:NUDIX domain-containing protein [Sphingomonas sp. UYP23]
MLAGLLRLMMQTADGVRQRYWRWRGRPRLATAALAYTPDGELLFVRQTYTDGWCLPGGGRRATEEPIAAALRELREEIGLFGWGETQWRTTIHRPFSGVPVATDVVIVSDVTFAFRRNLEVEAVSSFAPAALPADLNPWAITVLTVVGLLHPAEKAAFSP